MMMISIVRAATTKWRLFGLGLAFLFGMFGISGAKDVYIAQDTHGDGSGATANDARSVAWFNNVSNWGTSPTQITSGDTIRLCGTITNGLSVRGSGIPGSNTVIFFEPGAKISMPSLPETGGIALNNCNYLTVDGGADGVLECTKAGSGMLQTTGVGVRGMPTIGNILIRNLEIRNLYVKTNYSDQIAPLGIYISGSGISNIVVANNHITWCATGVMLGYSPGSFASSGFLVISNRIEYVNHGTTFGSGNIGGKLTRATFAWNRVGHFEPWDDLVSNSFHHNGFIAWTAQADTAITDLQITNNIIWGRWGTRVTAGIFLSGEGGVGILNPLIANNLIAFTNGSASNGAMYLWNVRNPVIANNTVCDNHSSIGIRLNNCAGVSLWNNIFYGSSTIFYVDRAGVPDVSASDWNIFSGYKDFAYVAGTWASFAQWQGRAFDANSVLRDPLLAPTVGGTYPLRTGSPARKSGTNLYSILKSDGTGSARPQTGAWDIGAFQYPGSPLPSPLNLHTE